MRELEYNLQLFWQFQQAQQNRLESRPELFLSRYFDILQSKEARERYLKKLQLVDPYEISLTFLNLACHDLHSWPAYNTIQYNTIQ